MKSNKNKGFTLIELLVVIAIIGILSSVVLASLNTARQKGKVAAVKAQLSNMRADAEIYYDSFSPNSYANLCDPTTSPGRLYQASLNQGTGADHDCQSNAQAWGAYVQIASSKYFCVDSTGTSAETSATALNQDLSCNIGQVGGGLMQ